jgi:hypothetical protein
VGVAVVGVLVGAIVGDAVGPVDREKHRVSTCLVEASRTEWAAVVDNVTHFSFPYSSRTHPKLGSH